MAILEAMSPVHKPFWRHLFEVYAIAAIFFTSLILFFAGVEVISSSLRPTMRVGLLRSDAEAFKDYPWFHEYWQETQRGAFTLAYHPYEGFRMKPFQGHTVTIGAEGFRWVPGQNPEAQKHVILLGGSTMLGVGAPDLFTIPAQLQQLFNRHAGTRVTVHNRGVGSWVSSQELMHLVMELKAGRIPSVVVFYDGANDTQRGLENLRAGGTVYDHQLVDYFEGGESLLRWVAYRQNWMGSKLLGRFLDVLRTRLKLPIGFIPYIEKSRGEDPGIAISEASRKTYVSWKEEQKEKLAEEIATAYLANVKLAQDLARVYGFKVLCVWQPTLWDLGTKRKSEFEQRYPKTHDPMIDLKTRVTARVLRNKSLPILDFTDAFAQRPETLYSDECHLLPPGNKVISDLLYKELKRVGI